jgi:hypothetical protein
MAACRNQEFRIVSSCCSSSPFASLSYHAGRLKTICDFLFSLRNSSVTRALYDYICTSRTRYSYSKRLTDIIWTSDYSYTTVQRVWIKGFFPHFSHHGIQYSNNSCRWMYVYTYLQTVAHLETLYIFCFNHTLSKTILHFYI